MLFFVVCACFALFPGQVLSGAQNGLALCINAVIPSLLPFMLLSSCVIKSKFSRPLGVFLGKVLTPLTGISPNGCVCLVTGLIGGYGAGARAVYESFKEGQLSKEETERILPFCNNAGPLFIMGTVGAGLLSDNSLGIMLFFIHTAAALICARVMGGGFKGERLSLREEWCFYKKNKPPLGKLITSSAIESGGAIINACVFVITFSAILEILPFGQYSLTAGILEVTRGAAELSRKGRGALPLMSAVLAWGGMSVHFQASALTSGELSMKNYYIGLVFGSMVAFLLTRALYADKYVLLFCLIVIATAILIGAGIRWIFHPQYARQPEYRQRQHS